MDFTFKHRQQRLLKTIGEDAIAIVVAANETLRSNDSHYYFRQDSNFYYLTGFPEPEAVAIFAPGYAEGEYILFNRQNDPAKEQWEGKRVGQNGACEIYGADLAYPIDNLEEYLSQLLQNRHKIYYDLGFSHRFDHKLTKTLNKMRAKACAGLQIPDAILSLQQILQEWRVVKLPEELTYLRKAAKISALAHKQAMKICQGGMMEYELEAQLLYDFYRQGCRSVAYNSIVAGGKNACTLHYDKNQSVLNDGELVLIDAGGEYKLYAADITRTFPINGKFSAEQKAIYEIVLEAQLRAIDEVRVGNPWNKMQEIIVQIITQGLMDLNILQGSLSNLIEQKAYLPFYMHNSGHWLGLDVHDVGEYKVAERWRPLESGMVLTVEPGIYITEMPNVDKRWHNIGIRIEDDVVVTDHQPEILSYEAPKTIMDIESWMANTRV
jgi:Xaa-Pro aminopeptidase